MVENMDGSIFAHVPADWIKIQPKRAMTQEQIEKAIRNFKEVADE